MGLGRLPLPISLRSPSPIDCVSVCRSRVSSRRVVILCPTNLCLVTLLCLVLRRRRRLPIPCSRGFSRLSAQLRPPRDLKQGEKADTKQEHNALSHMSHDKRSHDSECGDYMKTDPYVKGGGPVRRARRRGRTPQAKKERKRQHKKERKKTDNPRAATSFCCPLGFLLAGICCRAPDVEWGTGSGP